MTQDRENILKRFYNAPDLDMSIISDEARKERNLKAAINYLSMFRISGHIGHLELSERCVEAIGRSHSAHDIYKINLIFGR